MSSDVTHIITIKINTFPVLFPWVRDAGSEQNLDKISNKYSQSHTHMEDDKMKIQWNSGISLDTLDSIEDIKHRNGNICQKICPNPKHVCACALCNSDLSLSPLSFVIALW